MTTSQSWSCKIVHDPDKSGGKYALDMHCIESNDLQSADDESRPLQTTYETFGNGDLSKLVMTTPGLRDGEVVRNTLWSTPSQCVTEIPDDNSDSRVYEGTCKIHKKAIIQEGVQKLRYTFNKPLVPVKVNLNNDH